MRTKFSIDDVGVVTLSYDLENDEGVVERIERRFTCPAEGGYVLEDCGDDCNGAKWNQVCDLLKHRGDTLFCSDPDKLIEMIRREYNIGRRYEKREAEKREMGM